MTRDELEDAFLRSRDEGVKLKQVARTAEEQNKRCVKQVLPVLLLFHLTLVLQRVARDICTW